MLITRRNPFTQDIISRHIDCTPEQLKLWDEGMLIQEAFPNLSANDREFIKTGITPEQWDRLFGVADENTGRVVVYEDDDKWPGVDSGVEGAV